jgi:hypothetical protein
MQRTQRLRDETYVANTARIVPLDNLPPGHRVRSLQLYCNVTGTKDVADALDGQLFAAWLSSVKIGSMVNIPGWHLQALNRSMLGKVYMDPTDIPGSGTTFSVNFALVIPFRDPRQPGADDGAVPCEMFAGKSLELSFAAGNVHGVGNLVATGGTVRVVADLVAGSAVPQVCQIGYLDPGSQTIEIDPGIYKDLIITDGTTTGTVTQAEITSVDFSVDGQAVHNNALHEQLVAAYNAEAVRDAAAELAVNAATYLPVVWHDHSGKSNLTKQPAIEKKGILQITGSLATPRISYWRSVAKDASAIEAVAAATGAPSTAVAYEPAVASKSELRAKDTSERRGAPTKKHRLAAAHLPGKFRTTPTRTK